MLGRILGGKKLALLNKIQMYASLFLVCAGTNSYIEAFLLTCEHVHNMFADALRCEEAAEEVAKLVNKTTNWKQIL